MEFGQILKEIRIWSRLWTAWLCDESLAGLEQALNAFHDWFNLLVHGFHFLVHGFHFMAHLKDLSALAFRHFVHVYHFLVHLRFHWALSFSHCIQFFLNVLLHLVLNAVLELSCCFILFDFILFEVIECFLQFVSPLVHAFFECWD